MKPWLSYAAVALPLLASIMTAIPATAAPGVESTDPAAVPAGVYEIDPSHTSVAGRVVHLGFSSTTIRFSKISGNFNYDPAHPEQAKLSVTVDAGSLSTDWAARDNELRGPSFFDIGKFPTATFTAGSLTRLNGQKALVKGNLTLLGITRPVDMEVTLRGAGKGMAGDTRVGFEAHMTVQRTDFGMKAFVPAVADRVDLTIDAEFTKKS